jgi:hypothetical protein
MIYLKTTRRVQSFQHIEMIDIWKDGNACSDLITAH